MNSYYWTILMGFLVNLIYLYGIEGRPASNLGGCESTYCAGLRDICKNGGKCVEDPTNRCQGKCKCSARYSGPYCEVDKSSLPIILAPERHRQPRRYGNIMSFFASLSRKSSKTTKGTTTTTTTTKAPVTSTSTSTTESQSPLEIDDIKGGNVNETLQDSKNSDDSNSESEINDNKNDKQDSSVLSTIPNDKEEDMDGNKRNITSESDTNKSEKKEDTEPRLGSQITEEDNDGNKTDTTSAEKKQDTKENKPSYLKRKITNKINSDTNNTKTVDNSNEESQSLEILQNNTSSEEDKGEVDVVSTDLELTLESFRNLLQVDSLFSDGFGLPELQDSSDHVGSNNRGLLGDLAPVVSKRPVNDVGAGAALRKTPLTKTSNDNAPSDVISQRMSSLSSVHGSAQDHVFSELSQLIDVPNSKPISTFKPIVLTTVSPLELFLSNVMINGAETQSKQNSNKHETKKNSAFAAKELVFPDLETIINSNKLPPNKPNVAKNVTTQEKNETSERKSNIKTEAISKKENVSVSFHDGLSSDVNLIQNVLDITNVSKANDLESLVNQEQINTSFNSSFLKKKETVILQDENTKKNTSENVVISELQKLMKNTSDLELKRNRTSDKSMNKTKIINDNNFVTSNLNSNKNASNVTPGVATALKSVSFVPHPDTDDEIKTNNGKSLNDSTETRKELSGILSSLTASHVHDGNLINLNESDSDKRNSSDNKKFNIVEINKKEIGHTKDSKESHENTTRTNVNKTNSTNNTEFAIQTTDSMHQTINPKTGSDKNDTKQNETSEIDGKATDLNINQIEPATNITINDGMQSSKKKIGIDHIKENTSMDDNLSETSNKTVIIESSEISPSVNESIILDNGNNTDTVNTDVVPENKKNETNIIDKDLVKIGSSNQTLNDNKVAFSKQNFKKNKTETDILKTTENKISEHVKKHKVKEVSTVFDPVMNNNENYNMNGNIGPALASDSFNEFPSVNVKSSDVKFSALKAVSRELATKDGDNTIENINSMKNRLNEKSHFIDVVEGISPKESLTLKGNGALFVTNSDVYGQTGGSHLKQEIIVTSSTNEQTKSTTATSTTTTATVSVINKQLLSNESIQQSSEITTENANKSTISSIGNDNKILSQVSNDKPSDHHLINSIVTSDSNVGTLKSADAKLVKTENTNEQILDLPKVIKANIMLPSADNENSATHLDTIEKTTKTPKSENGVKFKTVTETNILLSSNTKKGNDTSKIIDKKETPKSSEHSQEEATHGNGLEIPTVTETSTAMPLPTKSSGEHSQERTRSNSLDIPTFIETNPDMHSTDKLSSEHSQMATRGNGLDLLIVNETGTDMPSSDWLSSEHAKEANRSNGLDLPTVIKTNTTMPSSDLNNMSVAEITSSQNDSATTNIASDIEEVRNITQTSDKGIKMLTTTVSTNTAKENDTMVTFQSDNGSSNNIESVTNMSSSGNIVEGDLSALTLVDSKMKKNKNGFTQIQTVDENNNSSLIEIDNIPSNGNINVQSKKLSNVLNEDWQPPIDNSNTSDISTSNKTSMQASDLSSSVLDNTTLPGINENENKLLNIQKPNR